MEDRLYKICLSRLYPFKFLKRLSFTNFTCSIFWVLCPICYTTPCRLYRYKNWLFLRWCFTIFFTRVSHRCFKLRIKTSWFCFLRVYKCFIKSIKAVPAQRLLFSWEGMLNHFFFCLVLESVLIRLTQEYCTFRIQVPIMWLGRQCKMLQETSNYLFLFCFTCSTRLEQSNYGSLIIEILKYPQNCTEIWYYFGFFWTDRICSQFFSLNFAFDDLFSYS